MALRWVLVGWLALAGMGSAAAQERQRPPQEIAERAEADAAVDAFTSRRLTRFASEAEFTRYADALRRAARLRRSWWAARPVRFASLQTDSQPPLCPPEQPDCLGPEEGASEDSIVVTGSMVRPSNPSITNNQMVGVDEGDIVKQIGQFSSSCPMGGCSPSTRAAAVAGTWS